MKKTKTNPKRSDGAQLLELLKKVLPKAMPDPGLAEKIYNAVAAEAQKVGDCGSGGLIPTNSTTIVPFSSADRRRKIASNEVPDQCGNGHRLTPDNVRIDGREGRWRCRQCGCDRAAAFRDRQRTG